MGYYGGYPGAYYSPQCYGYGYSYQPCCNKGYKKGPNTGFFFALIVLLFILFVIIGGFGYY
ncbi:sporulation protein YjcZ [Alkalicoccobacillus plakortidis]|uniref:Sporulation protein YjcZ n=1 Tax=Alkalicoccobacillus plakortidis TaxID=444060 RepID=A0ABT0XM14_9BACI|nr:sporulation protein YjcZ [Alkalicoccobacillus plakortidis]MCM2676953.1 sporulation protein YjcZ [Alkalicoccobacillus plakortidis]